MKYKRILAIIEFLWLHASKDNPKSIEDIQVYLEKLNMEVGIKALRNDLQFLTSDDSIIKVETSQNGRNQYKFYWIQNRVFEMNELRYLMDAISAARFISEIETRKILEKLKIFVSVDEANLLENQLVYSQPKLGSPYFGEVVQNIHYAISEKRTIQFHYGRYNINKKFILKGSPEPKLYQVNPYAIIWNNEKYYLIAYNLMDKEIRHYRIDRIREIEVLEKKFVVQSGFDVNRYKAKLFNMYAGEETTMEVIFHNHLITSVIDRFGLDANIKSVDNNHFRLITRVIFSKGLIRWLLKWGADAKVIHPPKLVDEMKKESEKLYRQYFEENGEIPKRARQE